MVSPATWAHLHVVARKSTLQSRRENRHADCCVVEHTEEPMCKMSAGVAALFVAGLVGLACSNHSGLNSSAGDGGAGKGGQAGSTIGSGTTGGSGGTIGGGGVGAGGPDGTTRTGGAIGTGGTTATCGTTATGGCPPPHSCYTGCPGGWVATEPNPDPCGQLLLPSHASWNDFTYHCHTASDTCLNNSDCAPDEGCIFDEQNGYWSCVVPPPPPP